MDEPAIRILLVERDPVYADQLSDGLADDTMEVTVVPTLDAAAARAAAEQFDVAVIGPELAGSKGVWRQIRAAMPTLPLVPVEGPTQRHVEAADVLDNLADVVLSFLTTSHGPMLINANRRIDELLGISADDLVADPERVWRQLDPADVRQLREALTTDNLFLEDAPRVHLRWYDRHGSVIRTEGIVSARRDARGRVIAADLALRLDTERGATEEALRQTEAQYRALADSVTDAVFRMRVWPRLMFDYANPACTDVLGVPVAELKRDASRLLGSAHADHVAVIERALQEATARPTTIRYDRVGANGRRTVELSLTPVRDDPKTGVELLGIARDVTASAETEATLRAALARATAQVDTAATAAAQPASTVAPPAAPANPEPTVVVADIADVVVEAVARTDLGARTVDVHRETVLLRHDVPAVRRAVIALLENVRRHTPPGTRATVTIAEAVDSVLITVADDGPGFPWPDGSVEQERGSMQLHPDTGDPDEGLGAVAKVARAHDGRAWVQSAPGQGTIVRLLLRAIRAQSSDEVAEAPGSLARVGHTAP